MADKKKTIALVSGAMRPPHAGHWSMIEKYADLADEVKVIISNPKNPKSVRKTKNGTIITPEMSKEIFEIFIKRYNLGNKVKVEISEKPSPVTAAFDYVDNEIKNAKVYLGSSKKDDDWKRFSAAPEYFKDRKDIEIVDPEEAAVSPLEGNNGVPFSATQVRNNIDNPSFIKTMMPKRLTQKDVKKIVSILSATNESITDNSSDFFKRYIDVNESTISYLGNLKGKELYFGPSDSLCEIHLVSKDGKNKIDAFYKQKTWNVEFNGRPVKESSKGYRMLTQSDDFKKMEAKLFRRWEEMIKYPRRMVKNAQKSFEQKYSETELKAMCRERLAFLKENF